MVLTIEKKLEILKRLKTILLELDKRIQHSNIKSP